jgi:hypothetical protein
LSDVVDFVFQLLYPIVHAIQPFLVPICLVCAWAIVFLGIASIWGAICATTASAKQMHQIPCSGCVFFTNDYRLKCPVNPKGAMSEEAINCPDYRER